MDYPEFIGSLGSVESPNHNAERTINLYEASAPGRPKVKNRLTGTPGYKPFAVLRDGPVRALFAQDGRMWAVGGSGFSEILPSGTVLLRGSAQADGDPATISSNGSSTASSKQLFVTSGGKGYAYSLVTNAITEVTTNAEPVKMGAWSDGYFFAIKKDDSLFTLSELNDASTWDPLDFQYISTANDQVRAIIVSHREIWFPGSKTTSVWQNTGDADNPFQPIPSVQIENGIAGGFCWAKLDNTIFWLSENELGRGVMMKAEGYAPKRISNEAVEYFLDCYPYLYNALGWAYLQRGHLFFLLYLPTEPITPPGHIKVDHTTLVYDVSTGKWHERALWDAVRERWQPDLGRCHCYAFGKHLVGDRGGPGIYEMSPNFATIELAVAE